MAKRVFSFEFISLNFVSFFAFCNMAVFYGFCSYLGSIGIPKEWRRFLVGLEPMTAFALRLMLVPLIHAGNALGVMLAALVMMMLALNAYAWARTIAALAVPRVFHGAAFVLLVSAGMALVVQFIPKDRSTQGFGLVSGMCCCFSASMCSSVFAMHWFSICGCRGYSRIRRLHRA